MRVVLISLEPWDQVWRRNQHLAAQLVGQGLVEHLTFVQPPSLRPPAPRSEEVGVGIEVTSPRLLAPKRVGGLRTSLWSQRRALERADVLWVNDPALGVHALAPGRPAVYDVTDDWRTFSFPPRILRRITRAENRLAQRARTVVCSPTLQQRWQERYGVQASVVLNGVDDVAWRQAQPRVLDGPGPHVGYIGTLQADRLDVGLVQLLARHPAIGTVHLVGPNAFDEESKRLLGAETKIVFHGAVPAVDVPAWSMAMDVLVSPHRISDFTLSLDAIKAREYVASGRPVVATATSGFQLLGHPRVHLAPADRFVPAVALVAATGQGSARPDTDVPPDWTWASRARAFHKELLGATGSVRRTA